MNERLETTVDRQKGREILLYLFKQLKSFCSDFEIIIIIKINKEIVNSNPKKIMLG